MNLNDLFDLNQIDPSDVLVVRHRPSEPKLNRALPWLAAERPDLFNAYQQTQTSKLESAMLGAGYFASFIGHEPGKALFVGLYKIGKSKPLSFEDYRNLDTSVELRRLGMLDVSDEEAAIRKSLLFFDLDLTKFYTDWTGKLIIGWPGSERSWWRRAHRNTFPIISILEESAFVRAAIPRWEKIDLSWADISILPKNWKAALEQWRGIYLIFDEQDGKSYVGSAYGDDNLYGRWATYASTGHGGNRLLRARNPQTFRFTILQRVSPDMSSDEIIRLESTWKERLHTRKPFGLNDN